MQKANEEVNLEFRVLLQEEFARRVRRNERYSMRSFARHLNLDSSTLSKVLSGRRFLSEKKIDSLCKTLGIKTKGITFSEDTVTHLDVDAFAAISDWYHFAILDLTLLKTFKFDISWIAYKLSIEPYQARSAIERLKRLGVLVEKNGTLIKAKEFYSNYSEGITSAALKEYQRQIISKALQAVDDCPQESKDITSMTIAADSRKIKGAKEIIKKFRRDLCRFMETGQKDSVYHLAIQLHPVTRKDK